MHNKNRCRGEHGFGGHGSRVHDSGGHRNRRGPSSFSMQDPTLVFNELKLKEGEVFLDMGCGAGDYTIQASKILGDSGVVYALDVWEELISNLEEEAAINGLKNIKGIATDITDKLPIEDNSIDVCFIATVLHTMHMPNIKENLFNEIRRVLKPDGRLAIIECKKEQRHFGPPMHMRLSSEEMEAFASQHGFEKINLLDLGYNYMIQFVVK